MPDRGFTLIEVMIAMALVVMMFAAAVMGLRSYAKSDLRAAATHLAGTIRYLFDRASTTGRVHRLVLDFETGRYWAEASEDSFVFPAGKETADTRKIAAEEAAKEEEAEREEAEKESFFGASQIPARYLPKPFIPTRAKFKAFREPAVRPITLKSDVHLVDIYTPRLLKPLSTGRGYLYFFPMGMTEAAVIHLSGKDGHSFYSLVVHPLTGRVSVKNTFVEPDTEGQVDDTGKEILP